MRPWRDVVQVYADPPGDDSPSRLVGFAGVVVPAGGKEAFEVRASLTRLARRVPQSRSWRQPEGEHLVRVGRYAGDPDCTAVRLHLGRSPH